MISRRTMIGQVALAAAAPAAFAAPPAELDWYRNAIVIDGLSGVSDPYSPPKRTRMSERARAELRLTGVTAVNFTIGAVGNDPDAFDRTLASIKSFDATIKANPDFLAAVQKSADIAAAKAKSMIGVIYGTQDTSMVGNRLERVAELKAKGVRIMQLTYNLRNLCGDGALEPGNAGISKLGNAMIESIEHEKLLLDLSHGGVRTIVEAIAASKRPMSISHTGCRDLHDHPRNVHDSSLKALADKGGVVGIYFMPFLSANSKPTGEELVRHIEHAANVCGEDHISIGTDGDPLPIVLNEETWKRAREMHEFRSKNGFAAPGEGPNVLTIVHEYNRLDRFQRLSDVLAGRGWTTTRIEKLLGRNLLRLYGEAWGG